MATGVLRTRKDGGCSICRASDKNVGKRKCCHILDKAAIKVEKEGRTNFINIEGSLDGKDTSLTIKASDKKVKSFITNLSKGLSDDDRTKILAALR